MMKMMKSIMLVFLLVTIQSSFANTCELKVQRLFADFWTTGRGGEVSHFGVAEDEKVIKTLRLLHHDDEACYSEAHKIATEWAFPYFVTGMSNNGSFKVDEKSSLEFSSGDNRFYTPGDQSKNCFACLFYVVNEQGNIVRNSSLSNPLDKKYIDPRGGRGEENYQLVARSLDECEGFVQDTVDHIQSQLSYHVTAILSTDHSWWPWSDYSRKKCFPKTDKCVD